MFDEANTKTNLPAQIDMMSQRGPCLKCHGRAAQQTLQIAIQGTAAPTASSTLQREVEVPTKPSLLIAKWYGIIPQ